MCRKPKATLPVAGSASARTESAARSTSASARSTVVRKVRPAGVRETVRPLRANRATSEVLLQPDHGAREGRLGDGQLVGGAGHVLVAGDGREVGEARREYLLDVFFVTAG